MAGTNGISPIFLTTVGVTGGIGLDLQNWVNKFDADGDLIVDADGEAVLEQTYSVDTGHRPHHQYSHQDAASATGLN